LIFDVEGQFDSRKVIGGGFFNQIRLQKRRNIADGDDESCKLWPDENDPRAVLCT
jgi:hypothetical protein